MKQQLENKNNKDKAIASKEGKIKTYEQEADKLVEAKINLDTKRKRSCSLARRD